MESNSISPCAVSEEEALKIDVEKLSPDDLDASALQDLSTTTEEPEVCQELAEGGRGWGVVLGALMVAAAVLGWP